MIAGDGVVLDYSLNPQGYISGASQVAAINNQLQQGMSNLIVTTSMLERSMGAVTPKRAAIVGWTAMAMEAGKADEVLQQMQASSTVTNINVGKLHGSVNKLARDMPVGITAARQTVTQFTQMGVASEGSEVKIGKLSDSVLKLAGATGEGPAQLTQGMVELARVTGNRNLDPRRFSDLGDSLTTVSKEAGASATAALSFSRSIAPMAQAAGIGATGVLGISTAFAQLGEDSFGATTAINRILTDMTRAARDGTPEMMLYAQTVGKTREEFEALFKANPTEALVQVTEAIGNAGPGGPRILEQLGLDSARTMPSLVALTQSGQLRTTAASAQAGYGSGSTERAAEEAYQGLYDAMTKTSESARQLAEALGTPLLGPLELFTRALAAPTDLLGKMASSDVGQGLLTTAMYGGGAAMLGRGLLRPLATAAVGQQALTSGPMRSLFGGWAAGRGEAEGTTRASRLGAYATRNAQQNLWPGVLGPANRGIYGFARSVAQGRESGLRERMGEERYAARAARLAGEGPAGPGMGARMREGATGAFRSTVMGATWYANLVRQQMNDARTPDPNQRSRNWGAPEGMRGAGAAGRAAYQDVGGGLRGAGEAARAFTREVNNGAGGMRLLRQVVVANAMALGATGRYAGSQAGRLVGAGLRTGGTTAAGRVAGAAGGIGRGIASGAGLFGGPAGLALLGGIGVYGAHGQSQEEREQRDIDFMSRDIGGTLNRYRESTGRATQPVQTHASRGQYMAENLTAATQTMEQATQVTGSDIAAATTREGKPITQFFGTPEQMAAQVRNLSPGQLNPQDLQAIKLDLYKQTGSKSITEQVLSQVAEQQRNQDAGAPAVTGPGTADLAAGLRGALGAPQRGDAVGDLIGTLTAGSAYGTSQTARGQQSMQALRHGQHSMSWVPGSEVLGDLLAPGGALNRSEMTPEQREALAQVTDASAARASQQATTYGAEYSLQEQLAGAEETLKVAAREGSAEEYDELIRGFTASITGQQGGYYIKPEDLENLGETLAGVDENFERRHEELQKIQAEHGGTIEATEIQSSVSKNLQNAGLGFLAGAFDARGGSSLQQAFAASLEEPGRPELLDEAAKEALQDFAATGRDLNSFASEMTDALNQTAVGTPEWQLMQATQGRYERGMREEQRYMAPAEAMSQQYDYLTELATQDATTPEQQEQKKAAQDQLSQMDDANYQRMVERLTRQREYEVARERTQEDFGTQQRYARRDYRTTRGRMEESHELGETRAREEHGISEGRAFADFATSRERAERDFGIQLVRTREDYQLQLQRTEREFSIGMSRQAEDYQITRQRASREFYISIERMAEDHHITRERAQRDFHISMQRGAEDYRTSTERAERDFQISMQRGEEDYLTARRRQLEDFNTQMARAAEDAAKALYEPYQRIQTQATWDAQNLLVNLNEQNAAIARQKRQLDEIREMGVSQDVIDQLGLGDSKNAQQLDNLVRDMQSDPRLVREFNRTIRQRMRAGGEMFEDDSNVQRRRAEEDFAKSLNRAAEDYQTSIKRARADFRRSMRDTAADYRRSIRRARQDLNRQMRDMGADYQRGLRRAHADFRRQMSDMAKDNARQIRRATADHNRGLRDMEENLAIGLRRSAADFHRAMQDSQSDFDRTIRRGRADLRRQLSNAQEDLNIALDHMEEDFQRNMRRTERAHRLGLRRMAQDLRRSDEVIAGDMETLHKQLNKALHGQAVEWQQLVVDDSGKFVRELETKVLPEYKRVMSELGIDTSQFGEIGGGSSARRGSSSRGGGRTRNVAMAEGGEVPGFSPHDKADNIEASLTAGEHVQPREVVRHYGVDTFEALREKKVPKDVLQALVGTYSTSSGHSRLTPGPIGDGDVLREVLGLDVEKIFSKMRQDDPHIYGKLLKIAKEEASDSWGAMSFPSTYSGARGVGAGMPWQKLWALTQAVDSSAQMTSNYRPGAITASGYQSFHGRDGGRAIDLVSPNMAATFRALAPLLPWSELYYSPIGFIRRGQMVPRSQVAGSTIANHYDHVHAAYDEGGYLMPGQGTYTNDTGKPEPVLTNDQWQSISQLAEKAGTLVTQAESQALRTATQVHMTVYHQEQITHDYRNDFAGAQFNVQSQDPDDMARKLEAKAHRQRLTQTRGVRR